MAILPIGADVTPFMPSLSSPPGVSSLPGIGGIGGIGDSFATAPASGGGFADMLTKGIESVQATQDKASELSGKVATGELTDIHDFTTAAAKASLAVSLTSTVRNRAVEAYQEIMRMQL